VIFEKACNPYCRILLICLLTFLGAGWVTANAQQVVIFGTVDAYVDSTKSGNQRLLRVDSGGLALSRFGVRATESVGNGVSVSGVIEGSFNVDDGALQQSGLDTLLSAQGYFGRIAIGKQYTPQSSVLVRADAFGSSFWGTPYAVFAGGNRYNKIGNSIQYQTPRLFEDRLQVSAFYSFETPGTVPQGRLGFLTAQITAPPWGYLGIAFGRDERFSKSSPVRNVVLVGGFFDAGPVRLQGGYQQLTDPRSDASIREWTAGASTTLPAGKLMVSWARSHDNAAPGKVADTFGTAWVTPLSKLTSVYASAARLLNGAGSSKGFGMSVSPGSSSTNLMVGIRKNF